MCFGGIREKGRVRRDEEEKGYREKERERKQRK